MYHFWLFPDLTLTVVATKIPAVYSQCCQKRDLMGSAHNTPQQTHLQSDTWASVSPSCFEHMRKKAHVGSTRTNMEFLHVGASGLLGAARGDVRLALALICNVSPCQVCNVTIVYYLLSPSTIFGSAHKIDGFFLSPASLWWQGSRPPPHLSPPPPSTFQQLQRL